MSDTVENAKHNLKDSKAERLAIRCVVFVVSKKDLGEEKQQILTSELLKPTHVWYFVLYFF